MRLCIILFLSLSFISNFNITNKPRPLQDSDLQANGIYIGMSKVEVYDILDPRFDFTGGLKDAFTGKWKYQYGDDVGITVFIDSSLKVIRLDVDAHYMPTFRGLRVGETSAEALELYGNPDHKDDESWYYYYKGDHNRGMMLNFLNENSEISDTLSSYIIGYIGDITEIYY